MGVSGGSCNRVCSKNELYVNRFGVDTTASLEPVNSGKEYKSSGTPEGHPAVLLGRILCEFQRVLKSCSASFNNRPYVYARACLQTLR